MNSTSAFAFPARSTAANRDGATLCARPDCPNVVQEAWEETGTLCAKCAIESDLFDRAGRWDRLFPKVN